MIMATASPYRSTVLLLLIFLIALPGCLIPEEPVDEPTPLVLIPLPDPRPADPDDGTYYQVRQGDTLFLIADSLYGDGNDWPRIYDANPILQVHALQPGTFILIPD